MGWAVGYDDRWQRDIGYGVPAFCDEPGCDERIDRGLAYVCCSQMPFGGDYGCGLFFCEKHRAKDGIEYTEEPCQHDEYVAKPDHPDWIRWKLTHESWERWRKENPTWVEKNQHILEELGPLNDLCEGCNRPATAMDADGIPLCNECLKDLVESQGGAA